VKPLERVAQLHTLSKVYAKAKAETEYLKHFRKSKLAILKGKYSEQDSKLSNAACDDLARADKDYIEVLKGLREAIEVSEAAFWELSISKSGIQIWQTQESTRRAEMSMTGSTL
jgi:hypothetical protein